MAKRNKKTKYPKSQVNVNKSNISPSAQTVNPQPYQNQPEIPNIQSIFKQETKVHAGPIPSPEQLGEYENVSTGSANRIIMMAENQQNSRIEYQAHEQTSRYNERRLGQICAFIICMTVLVIVYKLAMNGKEIAASVLGVGGLAGIVTAFRKTHADKPELKK